MNGKLNTVMRGFLIFGEIWYSLVNIWYEAFISAAKCKI